MCNQKYTAIALAFVMLLAGQLYGQDLIIHSYQGPGSPSLMTQIKADTTANHGILPSRVYVLKRDSFYLNTEQFNVPAGSTLRLRAEYGTGKRPVIYQYPTGTGSKPQNPPGNIFVLLGGNLEMHNLIISGYFEPIDTNLNNVQGGLVNTTQPGSSIIVDSCILTNINGQHLRTGSASIKVQVTNSIFANMGALSTSNLGAGKGIDLREVSCDSLILVNNTFVNYQDRIVRHYNFSNPLAGTGGLNVAIIDHNTFVNGMGFHGLLSLGNVGEKIIITNNLFQDAFACGEDLNDTVRQAEWANTGEKYPNGRNRMSWIFGAPNDTTTWVIRNNYYGISDSGQKYLDDFGLTENTPLSWNINSRIGADSTTAFKKATIALGKIPRLMTNEMRWYRSPSGGNMTKNTPSSLWKWPDDDMDRRGYLYFEDTLNCSYATSASIYTAGDNSFPVGDLNWFPDKKAEWLTTGVVELPQPIPSTFSLRQNYPNPFNPTTNIRFEIPASGFVSLKVYNIIGQEIATLVNEKKFAGTYEVQFNGSNLSSGVYFYKLTVGNFADTKKFVLMK